MVSIEKSTSMLVSSENHRLKIKDIDSYFAPSVYFKDEAKIDDCVEEPLVKACKILYRKNVQTCMSSADNEDTVAYIALVPKGMSPENLEIAKRIGVFASYEEGRSVHDLNYLQMPINPEMEVAKVEQYFVALAEQFKEQSMTWYPGLCFAEYATDHGFYNNFSSREDALMYMVKQVGLFFDPNEELFYESEGLYRKSHLDYNPEQRKPIDFAKVQFDHWRGKSWDEIVAKYKEIFDRFKMFNRSKVLKGTLKPPNYLDSPSNLLPKWLDHLNIEDRAFWYKITEMLNDNKTASKGARLRKKLMDKYGYNEILKKRHEMGLFE